jgi:hypothetical protein
MAGKIKAPNLRLAKTQTQTTAARRLITMPSATPARQLQFNCGPSKAVSHCAAGKRSRSQLLSGRNTRFDARGRLIARPQGRRIRNLREFTRSKYFWADGIATASGF